MGKVLMLMTVILLAGCSTEAKVYDRYKIDMLCKDDTKQERKDFILSCIEKGNPHSDEEPEDWISICEDMAKNTYCEKWLVKERVRGSYYGGYQVVDVMFLKPYTEKGK